MKKYIKWLFTLTFIMIFLTGCGCSNNNSSTTKKSYNILFDTGSEVFNQVVLEGDFITKPENPVRNGYSFAGWTYNDNYYYFDKPVTSDMILTADWLSNGSGSSGNGENQEPDPGNNEEPVVPVNPESDKSYTVTFNSDGGTKVKSQTIKSGNLVKQPSNPQKNDYLFEYWSLNDTEYDFNTPVTENITLKATYTKINYISLSEFAKITASNYNQIEVNKTIEEMFYGCFEASEYKEYHDSYNLDKVSKVNYNQKIVCDFGLKENINGVLENYQFDLKYGKGLKLLKVVTDEGTKKLTSSNSNTYRYSSIGMVSHILIYFQVISIEKDSELYVARNNLKVTFTNDFLNKLVKDKYITNANKNKVKYLSYGSYKKTFEVDNTVTNYTVTFNSDGGSSVASQTVESGNKATKPNNPTKSGYTFKEWQLNGKAYDFNSAVTSNITLKAVWEAEETKVYTFNYKLVEQDLIDQGSISISKEVYLYVYENGSKVNFTSFKIGGYNICKASCTKSYLSEIQGETTAEVTLSSGKVVTANYSK